MHKKVGLLKWVILSILLHLIFIWELPQELRFLHSQNKSDSKYVKVSFIKDQKPKAPPSSQVTQSKKIIETIFEKNEVPTESNYLGYQDHHAKKETISKKKIVNIAKALDPQNAQKLTQPKAPTKSHMASKTAVNKKMSVSKVIKSKPQTKKMDVAKIGKEKLQKEELPYEEFLQKSLNAVSHSIMVEGEGGYQENLSKLAAEGDIVDLNTREYRYLGYFTNLRKAIELVWNYPLKAAENGWSGCVDLKFSIDKGGKLTNIEVLGSSGYPVLDNAIVSAIKLASPFAPLPKGISKEVLNITGSFDYVLNGI